jgi:phosphoglycerate dehydrogenase-like enzyme
LESDKVQVIVPSHVKGELSRSLEAILGSVEVVAVDVEGNLDGETTNAEVLLKYFPNDMFPGKVFDATVLRRVIQASPNIKWIHNGMTGMADLLYPRLVSSNITVTNAAGAHKDEIAEAALAMMLAAAKRFREHFGFQIRSEWHHLDHSMLMGRTVTIVGLGAVGSAIAWRCKALGTHVIAVKRLAVPSLPPHVDSLVTPDELPRILPLADYVAVSAALTSETRGLIGITELRSMKPSAYLVNIARGELVDEKALIHALREGWIAGACLDVFREEPLPASSPLWAMPNVIVTPHNAAWSPDSEKEALGLFLDNFKRYVTGQPLRNVVDKKAGY